MKYPKNELISQVKTTYLGYTNAMRLFKLFRLSQSLKYCRITKEKGHSILEMMNLMLLLILENASSVNAGLNKLYKQKFKTSLNNMLNDQWYNWRKLLYKIASSYIKMFPANKGKDSVLIIDDTAKEKTGRYGQNTSWFVNHSKQVYYMGFQAVVVAFSNGTTTIPIDFELKIGKKPAKYSTRPHYSKKSHSKQRERMAKRSKLDIAIQFMNRAMQRRYNFNYVLWDSWYVTGKTIYYVKTRLIPKGINLIAMAKRDGQRYLYRKNNITIKEIFNRTGKWKTDENTKVKYKSLKVQTLDKASSRKPQNREPLIGIRMCFFKYPKQKQYRIVISTDTNKSELEILELYLRRWSIEVVFKELKQHFGFVQSKSSNYAPQIADLTIRCIFYIMFCSFREERPDKTTQQLILEFYRDLEEVSLSLIFQVLFQIEIISLLELAVRYGYKDIKLLLRDIDGVLIIFFKECWHENKIEEPDNLDFKNYRYKTAG